MSEKLTFQDFIWSSECARIRSGAKPQVKTSIKTDQLVELKKSFWLTDTITDACEAAGISKETLSLYLETNSLFENYKATRESLCYPAEIRIKRLRSFIRSSQIFHAPIFPTENPASPAKRRTACLKRQDLAKALRKSPFDTTDAKSQHQQKTNSF